MKFTEAPQNLKIYNKLNILYGLILQLPDHKSKRIKQLAIPRFIIFLIVYKAIINSISLVSNNFIVQTANFVVFIIKYFVIQIIFTKIILLLKQSLRRLMKKIMLFFSHRLSVNYLNIHLQSYSTICVSKNYLVCDIKF